ncbi:MAG: hypothetical protein KAX44_00595 [Candidatus Brocadiae bacterium]|nr:hypothetical protein [Candidatus Brocadiia bacterium]
MLRYIMILMAAGVSASCSTVPSEHPVAVTLRLNSDSYEMGEPVEATVAVTNRGETELVAPALDNSTLKFYWGQPGTSLRLRRNPILPADSPTRTRVIPPRGVTSRTFLFTRLTPEAGEWGLMAALTGCVVNDGKDGQLLPTCYSEPGRFTVTDVVKFRRDAQSGIITKQQAMALARARAGVAEGHPARGVLVPLGESALCMWTVFLGGGPGPTGASDCYAVNAYTGVVKSTDLTETSEEGKE